jgi:hypothetical protein
VPSKFSPSGEVQPFPGNTILAHLGGPSTPLYAALLPLHAQLAARSSSSSSSKLYTLLPPESWHVTLFEGVCDQVRDADRAAPRGTYWPSDLAADAPLAECTAHFARKLKGFELLRDDGPPYRMRVIGFSALEVGIGVAVEPVDEGEKARLRRLRDRLSQELRIRHPGHDNYGLHVSMAYFLRWMQPDEEREVKSVLDGVLAKSLDHGGILGMEFELGAPEFCEFKDMFWFERLFYLGEGRESE